MANITLTGGSFCGISLPEFAGRINGKPAWDDVVASLTLGCVTNDPKYFSLLFRNLMVSH
jgi:hypothetical protein